MLARNVKDRARSRGGARERTNAAVVRSESVRFPLHPRASGSLVVWFSFGRDPATSIMVCFGDWQCSCCALRNAVLAGVDYSTCVERDWCGA